MKIDDNGSAEADCGICRFVACEDVELRVMQVHLHNQSGWVSVIERCSVCNH